MARLRHRLLSVFTTLFDVPSAKAREQAWLLLETNLTTAQREHLYLKGHFDVIGGCTGRRYRIHQGTSMNVHELDANNQCVRRWCFVPEGHLMTGDVMLAQKLALELFELDARAVARSLWIRM